MEPSNPRDAGFTPKGAARLPVVAIVGRPNVGKSTLFNRLVGIRKAIVGDRPGVTRDRNYGEAEWAGRKYRLVDTGGLETEATNFLEKNVQAQSRVALREADRVIFLLDGKNGLNPLDREAVDELRRVKKPVFFAVNKIDSSRREESLYEFFALGFDRLYAISAEHGFGIAELMDDVVSGLTPPWPRDQGLEQESEKETFESPCVAIVGRPNVGKSTLINRLLGFERSVVDSQPGTTRDSLDTPFEFLGESWILVDTAGIRRKARIDDRVERFSVSRSLRAVDRGDLVIHLIDGPEGVTDQDAQILGYAAQRAKALVLAVNKWDVLEESGTDPEQCRARVHAGLSFLDFAPVVFISASTGYGVRKLLQTAARVLKAYGRKVPTSTINQALQRIVRAHNAPLSRGRAIKFYYGTQSRIRPPTLTLFVNRPAAVPDSYRRYLIHQLRDQLGFENVPIRLDLRARREEKSSKQK